MQPSPARLGAPQLDPSRHGTNHASGPFGPSRFDAAAASKPRQDVPRSEFAPRIEPPRMPAPSLPARIDTTSAPTAAPVSQTQPAGVNSPPRPPVSPITPTASFAQLAADQLPPPVIPPPATHPTKSSQLPKTASAPPAPISAAAPPPQSRPSPPRAQARSQPSQAQAGGDTFARPPPPAAAAQSQSSQSSPPQTKSAKEATFIPPPEPVDLGPDNTDEAALRSALAILQIQRDKARRDISTLSKLKNAASEDPVGFTEQMLAGNLSQSKDPSDPLAGTLESDEDDEDEDVDGGDKTSSNSLPKFPTRQNIVRCPPVNWAKYHVVGDGLDRMHEDQRRRPTLGVPSTGDWTGRDHVVAAPYSPGEDRWALLAGEIHPMQTRKGSKKPT